MTKINSVTRALVFALLISLFGLAHLQAEQLKVGTWKTAQTIQPFFYQDFLEKEDKASVFAFTNPADQKTALLAGSLDMAGTTLAHAIRSAVMGQPVVIVAALCNKCSALVVQKDGPVKTIKDLKGRKIGYVPGTMHEILLREALQRSGLSPDRDVTLVRVDFFDMGTALAGGDIDAFLSGEPFPTLAVNKGFGRVLCYPYYGESVGTINAGMIVTKDMIKNNPQAVQKLVDAHAKATETLNGDRKSWINKAETFGTPRPILEEAASNIELAWNMDEGFVNRARALGKRMQELGVIDRQPDYDALFDLRFVRQYKMSNGLK